MWSELLTQYSLFILKAITFVVVFAICVAVVFAIKQKKKHLSGELIVTDLSEHYQEYSHKLQDAHFDATALKEAEKTRKKAAKQKAKAGKLALKKGECPPQKPCLYVIDFKGDIQASQTQSLREEINAILSVARPDDEVLVRLESPGGVVHGYGLAASQLNRLKERSIKLTIAVDKVAASGGYMMACVADKIVAAPFAILGSIGVVAQVPNIHRLLKKHDVDVDVMTAGEYKRTVTVLGENTEQGKAKFRQELQEIHHLFKQFVTQHRPQVDIDAVATGEHWFGLQALERQLVDEIATSDDIILKAIEEKSVLSIHYAVKKTLAQKWGKQIEESAVNIFINLCGTNYRKFF